MAIIAEWKGDSDGQLLDSSGNGNDLVIWTQSPLASGGSINNPSSPSPPQGDRWLGHISNSPDQNPPFFVIPTSAKPKNAEGYISFYLNGSFVEDTDLVVSNQLVEFNNSSGDRYLTIRANTSALNDPSLAFVEFTDSLGSDHFLRFDKNNLFDGTTRKIVVSWDETGLKTYINDVQDMGGSINGVTPDFGDAEGNFVPNRIFLTSSQSDALIYDIYMDDVILSDTSFPAPPIIEISSFPQRENIEAGSIPPVTDILEPVLLQETYDRLKLIASKFMR